MWESKNISSVRNRKKELAKKMYWSDPEKYRKLSAEYYRNNIERCKEYQNIRHSENRDKLNEYNRSYYQNNKDKVRNHRLCNMDRYRSYVQRRRAMLKSLPIEKFVDTEIFDRDGWICGVCNKPVDKELKWPHPQSASLDHIKPISKGGPHIKVNVRLAHLVCNISIGNRRVDNDLALVAEAIKNYEV